MEARLPEDMLRKDKFQRWLEEMNEFFITLDHKLCFTYANHKVLRELEFPWDELGGRPLTLVVSPEMECETTFRIENIMKEQSPGECLSRFRSKSGRVYDIRVKAAPLVEHGTTVGVSILAEDVTEYEQQKEALDWRKKRMDTVADCMLDVMVRMDNDFVIDYVTPSVKRITGYDQEILNGMSIFTLLHPADRKLMRQAALELLSLEAGIARQCRMRHRDGHYIWMEAVGGQLVDESGQHNGFIISCRDVTARVEYEQELLKSRRNLQALFDSMQEGFALWQLVRDKQGQVKDLRCLDANSSFLKATRLKREKAIGLLNSKMQPALDSDWMDTFIEVVNSGQPRSFEGYSHQMKRYYEIYAFSPSKDVLACLFVDATRRITMEKQLAEERNWLKVVLGSVNEGIVATDVSGQVLFLNQKAAALMGWIEDEAVGQSLSDLFGAVQTIPPVSPEPGAKPHEEPDNENLTLADNTIVINRCGCKSIISNSSAPIYDPEGKHLGMVMVLSDITDQRLAQEKIEYLSFNDALTGLYNRAYVEHININSLMAETELPVSIILGDVNGLKLTNDVFGHLEGDRLLQRTAGILKAACRESDIIARWGGDEFLIMLPRSDPETAQMVCDRIRRHCRAVGGDPIEISISLGCATRTSAGQPIDATFRLAEDRMYENKVREKQQSREGIIASMERNLWRRSFESPEHNRRVRELALKIARELGLKGAELEHLALLASLHDIGKVSMESELLTRSGPLTAEETEQMRKHAETGYRMAEAIPELKTIAECIWCSHEAWDGSGYPRGLKGEAIPLMSRIIHLVHSYDVAANGVYKPAMGEEAARRHIMAARGAAHEPALVDILMNVLDHSGPDSDQESVRPLKRKTVN